ncbi:hypothetical protein [Rhodovulum marinum]|uniref:Uncharacterized protein n=1 Tax=Rhodovulum marinum TaxID=320662 RepID=A0A4R2Q3L5_9RHOB|nr:hypothetical protein [Rhodovulum marinum]TCP42308.1 hypothetical protein EV662_103215 [Rhodovulum marinum]
MIRRDNRNVSKVRGVHAPSPKPTIAGGLWLALLVTLPLAGIYGAVALALWLLG